MTPVWVADGRSAWETAALWYPSQEACRAVCEQLARDGYDADTARLQERRELHERRNAEIAFLAGRLGKRPLLEYVGVPFAGWTSFEEWAQGRMMHEPARFEVAGEPGPVLFFITSTSTGAVFTGRAAREAYLHLDGAERALLAVAGPTEQQYQKLRGASAKKFRYNRNRQQRRHDEWQLLVEAGMEPSFDEPDVPQVHDFPSFEAWSQEWRRTSPSYQESPLRVAGLTVTAFTKAEEAAA